MPPTLRSLKDIGRLRDKLKVEESPKDTEKTQGVYPPGSFMQHTELKRRETQRCEGRVCAFPGACDHIRSRSTKTNGNWERFLRYKAANPHGEWRTAVRYDTPQRSK
jgi:hypothetical protein